MILELLLNEVNFFMIRNSFCMIVLIIKNLQNVVVYINGIQKYALCTDSELLYLICIHFVLSAHTYMHSLSFSCVILLFSFVFVISTVLVPYLVQ